MNTHLKESIDGQDFDKLPRKSVVLAEGRIFDLFKEASPRFRQILNAENQSEE